MKKLRGLFVFLFIFLFLSSYFVIAQTPLQDQVDQGTADLQKVKDFTEQDKWDYLAQQWKEVLFRSQFIVNLDALLQKINPVFFLLTGQNYDFSLFFLFSLMLFFLFFFMFGQAFSFFSPFSFFVGWAISFILAILLGQAGIYYLFSTILFKILFFREGIWRFAGIILFIVAYLFLMASIRSIFFNLKLKSLMADEALKKKLEDMNRKELEVMIGKLRRGLA